MNPWLGWEERDSSTGCAVDEMALRPLKSLCPIILDIDPKFILLLGGLEAVEGARQNLERHFHGPAV